MLVSESAGIQKNSPDSLQQEIQHDPYTPEVSIWNLNITQLKRKIIWTKTPFLNYHNYSRRSHSVFLIRWQWDSHCNAGTPHRHCEDERLQLETLHLRCVRWSWSNATDGLWGLKNTKWKDMPYYTTFHNHIVLVVPSRISMNVIEFHLIFHVFPSFHRPRYKGLQRRSHFLARATLAFQPDLQDQIRSVLQNIRPKRQADYWQRKIGCLRVWWGIGIRICWGHLAFFVIFFNGFFTLVSFINIHETVNGCEALLFSATMPPRIERLAADFLNQPVRITVTWP